MKSLALSAVLAIGSLAACAGEPPPNVPQPPPPIAAPAAATVALPPKGPVLEDDEIAAFCMHIAQEQNAALDALPKNISVVDLESKAAVNPVEILRADYGHCYHGKTSAWAVLAGAPRYVAKTAARAGVDADGVLVYLDRAGERRGLWGYGLSEIQYDGEKEVRLLGAYVRDLDGDGVEDLVIRTQQRGQDPTTRARAYTIKAAQPNDDKGTRLAEHWLTADKFADYIDATGDGVPDIVSRGLVGCTGPSDALRARRDLYVTQAVAKPITDPATPGVASIEWSLENDATKARAKLACPSKPKVLGATPALDVECMKLWGASASEIDTAYSAFCKKQPKARICKDAKVNADEFTCWARASIPKLLP